ncbi:MAG: hypothetical protein HFG14_13725 [Lachnospiraceae bacterium]|nr:hypothetical protein [Lachnospiraceae bacterium]
MNILSACIGFVCGSVVDGVREITWEAIRKSGKYLIVRFKQKFIHFFADELCAEVYLKTIAEKECYNESDPFQDAISLYLRENKNRNQDKFKRALYDWIKMNEGELTYLFRENGQQTVGLSIGRQNVYGGDVKNIGIEYRNAKK